MYALASPAWEAKHWINLAWWRKPLQYHPWKVMVMMMMMMMMMVMSKLLHFEWSPPPWHHIETYLSQILTFFVLKSGEDEKEMIILMKSRALRSLDFIRIILSSSSLLLIRGPAVTTVIYQAKLIQTDSRYAWFKQFQTPGRRLETPRRLDTPRRLETKIWKIYINLFG